MTLKLQGGVLKALIASTPKAPNPTGEPRVIPNESPEHKPIVESIVRQSDAQSAAAEVALDSMDKPSPAVIEATEENITGDRKLSRLVDDDFPFDDSQLEAVYGIVREQYACMTGAAGTGKTTTTKKIVDLLQDGLNEVDMTNYWKRAQSGADEDDSYDEPQQSIPSIALCAFTGRAAQMVKKNFPVDWHGNIMTIHRMLGFYPEFFEEFDSESGEMRNTMRFVPTYTADNRMPWDIIVIDESGMLGLDLWHMVLAAMKDGCRVIMIGDINQLPPTHGKSVFGFAMTSWPSWELTHVHRQQGANNSIVDNAHRILKGLRPVSDSPTPLKLRDMATAKETLTFMLNNKDWRFLTVDVDEGSTKAGAFIRQALKLLKGANFYDPNRDAVITAINGYDTGQTGFGLGQDTMNRELSMILNPDNPRWIIDAGRERRNFAVGDKVMATKNDWEAGITNGMTGIITSIVEHGEYAGDTRAFGRADLVQEYHDEHDDDGVDGSSISLEEFNLESYDMGKKEKEKQGRGPASHILTIKFGEGASAVDMTFSTQAEVASIQLAYVVTCHKMQGGEAPLVLVILHQSHKRMLNREWFYTAVTRASQRCVVLCTRDGIGTSLGKQNIKGKTLAEKIKAFQDWQKVGIAGPTVRVKLPKRKCLIESANLPVEVPPAYAVMSTPEITELQNRLNEAKAEVKKLTDLPPQPTVIIRERTIIIEKESSNGRVSPIDGGDLTPKREDAAPVERIADSGNHIPQLERSFVRAKRASTLGAIRAMSRIEDVQSRRLLTYQPKPTHENVGAGSDSGARGHELIGRKPKVNIAALIRSSQKKG